MSTTAVSPTQGRAKRGRSDDDDDDGEEGTQRRNAFSPLPLPRPPWHYNDDERKRELETMKRLLFKGLRSSNEEHRLSISLEGLSQILRAWYGSLEHAKLVCHEFFRLGGHAIVVRVMNDHPGCKGIQKHGISTLNNACVGEEKKDAIADVEGMQATLAAMKTFETDKDLQTVGVALLIAVVLSYAYAKLIVDLGGIGIILQAMKTFPNDDLIVCRFSYVTNQLCRHNLQKHLYDANARTALASAMDNHKTDDCIQEHAGEAMEALMEYAKSVL